MSNLHPSDLRIGNIVRNASGPFRVGINTLLAMSSSGVVVEGVIPSPSLLADAGFELFPWGWVKLSSNDFGVRLRIVDYAYEVSGNNAVPLPFLHDIQNLYKELTKEELTFPTLHEDADIND